MKALEAIFIVVFRSRRSQGDEDRRHWSHEAQDEGSHTAKESGQVGPPILSLESLFVDFLRSYVSFLPKNDPRKILGHLDVIWIHEA